MAIVKLFLPKVGEGIMEATIIKWLKQEGDSIKEEESIVEVTTDKIDLELPSPYFGTIHKILVKDHTIVKVGECIALLQVNTNIADVSSLNSNFNSQDDSLVGEKPSENYNLSTSRSVAYCEPADGRSYSPLVKRIVFLEGIHLDELTQIPGTGKDNRVTKMDMSSYIKHKAPQSKIDKVQHEMQLWTDIGDEVIEIDRVRQVIAARMVHSQNIAAHVTSFVEADVTELVDWREKNKENFKLNFGVQLTYTSLFIRAVIKALQDFPIINSHMFGNFLVKKNKINIGMAVALPNGNLIVPVIKDAAKLSLVDLAQKVNSLANKARNNELIPDEISGATYTISNLGLFNNIMGTPIIMQPQVAVLAIGTILKKPGVITKDNNDIIAIRNKIHLSHSYDHRAIDGLLGGGFVKRIADYLEDFKEIVELNGLIKL